MPQVSWSAGTYALVGMGVLFAGFLRAPMTSVFMVLEVSGNYSIILPVLVANTFAYLISRTFQPNAIFDVLTRQDGLELPSMEEQREESVLRVEDAMRPVAVPVLGPEETVDRALQEAITSGAESLLVRLAPSGWSGIATAELRTMVAADAGGASLSSLLNDRRIPYLHPDHPLETALRYVERWPLVPVVNRADFRRLEGVISQSNVLNRYREFGEG